MPALSIIIPTYNRLARLKVVLAALERQTYPRDDFEVLVVSDGSPDGTDDYLRNAVTPDGSSTPLHLTPLFQPNGGVATARNNGLAHATGDLVVFIDDDVVAAPELLSEHVAVHRRADPDAVVLGPLLIPTDFHLSPWTLWEQKMLNKQYGDMLAGNWAPTARQFYTGNASISRQCLVNAGGFNTSFRRAEDVELGYRLADAGMHFVYAPQARAFHYVERSFRSWLDIPYAYGRNDVIFTRDRGQTWLVPTILHEYHSRKALIRLLVRACMGHARLSQVVTVLLNKAALLGASAGIQAIPRAAYSGIFNLRHYQGIADEMGGRAQFFTEVERARVTPYKTPEILKPRSVHMEQPHE